jgi:hypothetical protein
MPLAGRSSSAWEVNPQKGPPDELHGPHEGYSGTAALGVNLNSCFTQILSARCDFPVTINTSKVALSFNSI